MIRRSLFAVLAVVTVCGFAQLESSCSGDDCSEDGQTEQGGPDCCSDGCGNRASVRLPRTCKDGKWVCEGSRGILSEKCASPAEACGPKTACSGVPEEPDPVPELCCELSCDGNKVSKRECKGGLSYGCPGGFVPISTCPDPLSACGGAVQKYRDNGFKLP